MAQSVGMEYVEPFTFTFTRSIIGGIVLIPVIVLLRKTRSAGMRRDAQGKDVATQPRSARELAKQTLCSCRVCSIKFQLHISQQVDLHRFQE